jgi:hypothetical protein
MRGDYLSEIQEDINSYSEIRRLFDGSQTRTGYTDTF